MFQSMRDRLDSERRHLAVISLDIHTDGKEQIVSVVSFYSRFIYTRLNFGGMLEGFLFLISNVSELHGGRCRAEPRRISFKFPNSMKESSKR